MRRVIVVLAGSLVVPWLVGFLTWNGLPGQIPIHFDLGGNPDGWVDRTWLNWFQLPIVVSLMTAWMGAVVLAIPRTARIAPFQFNTPNKAALMQLAPEARERVAQPMIWSLAGFLATINLMFAAMILAAARVAHGTSTKLPAWAIFPFLGVMVVIMVLGYRAHRQAMGREVGR